MQAVMAASSKQYSIDKQSDPVEFFAWLLNTLHGDLTGGRRKRASIITFCFQGELEITTLAGTGQHFPLTPAASTCRNLYIRGRRGILYI